MATFQVYGNVGFVELRFTQLGMPINAADIYGLRDWAIWTVDGLLIGRCRPRAASQISDCNMTYLL